MPWSPSGSADASWGVLWTLLRFLKGPSQAVASLRAGFVACNLSLYVLQKLGERQFKSLRNRKDRLNRQVALSTFYIPPMYVRCSPQWSANDS